MAGCHFSSSRRMALVSASTGPEPSARVVVMVESPIESRIEACTYRFPVSSDSSRTLQLLTPKRFSRVLRTLMQASLNETSLTV